MVLRVTITYLVCIVIFLFGSTLLLAFISLEWQVSNVLEKSAFLLFSTIGYVLAARLTFLLLNRKFP